MMACSGDMCAKAGITGLRFGVRCISSSGMTLKDAEAIPGIDEENQEDGIAAAVEWGGPGLYTWGVGDEGQLGIEGLQSTGVPPQKIALYPTRVESSDLEGASIVAVSAGENHSMAVTDDGALYGWGQGKHFCLGLGTDQSILTPTRVKALEGEHVIDVACGDGYTLAITKDGKAFSWGWSGNAMLGSGALGTVLPPTTHC